MNEKPIVLFTDHEINRKISSSFAKGINGEMCHISKFSHYNKPSLGSTYGYLAYQDIIYKPLDAKLSITTRFSMFDTDDYNLHSPQKKFYLLCTHLS